MTSTEYIAAQHIASVEREIRAAIAALPADYLARIGLGTPEAIEAHVAATVAAEVAA